MLNGELDNDIMDYDAVTEEELNEQIDGLGRLHRAHPKKTSIHQTNQKKLGRLQTPCYHPYQGINL